MNENTDSKDNLQKIKGIGESLSRALSELGIRSYAELARYSPERLEELLKDKVPPIALKRVPPKEWIKQARQLAGLNSAEPNNAEKTVSSASFETSLLSEKKFISRQDWREIADFFVSFGYEVGDDGEKHLKTRVHHSQEDQPMQWDGIASEELLEWMLNKANLHSSTRPETIEGDREEAQPMPQEDENVLQLGLHNVWVSEVKVPISIGRKGETARLRLESDLVLSGLDYVSYPLDQPLECAIDVILIDTETNQSNLVGTLSRHISSNVEFHHVQHDFPIPPVGRYQLYLVARSTSPAPLIAYRQGPVISVESGS